MCGFYLFQFYDSRHQQKSKQAHTEPVKKNEMWFLKSYIKNKDTYKINMIIIHLRKKYAWRTKEVGSKNALMKVLSMIRNFQNKPAIRLWLATNY